MQQAGNVNVIVGMAAMVAALAAATPQASAADLLKLATAQRGAWESAPPELGQSAGIFAKHGIDLDVVYTRDGEVEPSVTSGGTDVGVGVGTIGVLRAYAKGAPVRVIGASTTGTANYWYVQAESPIKTVKDINGNPNIIGDGINVAQTSAGQRPHLGSRPSTKGKSVLWREQVRFAPSDATPSAW